MLMHRKLKKVRKKFVKKFLKCCFRFELEKQLQIHYDNTYKDFTYNINKCNITYNILYLLLILLINDFTYNSK
jgi:hypothetical protein